MSRMWIWTVIGGLVLAGALLYHVGAQFMSTLPEDIRTALKSSARKNVRPLGVAGVILAWTLVFALYSMTLAPSGSSSAGRLTAQSGSGDSYSAPESGGTQAAAPQAQTAAAAATQSSRRSVAGSA